MSGVALPSLSSETLDGKRRIEEVFASGLDLAGLERKAYGGRRVYHHGCLLFGKYVLVASSRISWRDGINGRTSA